MTATQDVGEALRRATREVELAGKKVRDFWDLVGDTESVSIQDRRELKKILVRAHDSLGPIIERLSAGQPCGDGGQLVRAFGRLQASVLGRLAELSIHDDYRGHDVFDVTLDENID